MNQFCKFKKEGMKRLPIEKGGLADIGAADDDDSGEESRFNLREID